MSHRQIPLLAIVVLVFAVLACNFSGTPTSEPPVTSVPSAMPAASPVPSSSSPSGACANSLYPVVAGASWTYTTTIGVIGDYTRTIMTVSPDGFTDQDVFSNGATRTGEWGCDSGSLIAHQPDGGPTGVVQTDNATAEFQTTALSGVTLPAAVNVGDTWMQNFTLEGNESINGKSIPAKNETAYSCTAGGIESVTVPAGTFDAVRVDCNTEITITVTVAGAEVPAHVSSTSTMWYAAGVGMVKSDNVISGAASNTVELTAYNIP